MEGPAGSRSPSKEAKLVAAHICSIRLMASRDAGVAWSGSAAKESPPRLMRHAPRQKTSNYSIGRGISTILRGKLRNFGPQLG